jgi:hypothetical protein
MTSDRKHFILVMIGIPDVSERERFSRWEGLRISLAHKAKTNKAVTILAENTWLIQRDSGMLFASECVAIAKNHQLEYQHWFLDEA